MTSDPNAPHDLVTIAMIGGTDGDTRAIVEGVLAAAGIACVIEGSVVYGIEVARTDHARALALLRAEQQLAGRWIQYADDPAK